MTRNKSRGQARILKFPEAPKGEPSPWSDLGENERAFKDGQLHVMLQEILDSAGPRAAWCTEVNIYSFWSNMKKGWYLE